MSIDRVNCCKCGKFVGKDGNLDITYDNYNEGYCYGYPKCRECLNKQTRAAIAKAEGREE